MAWSRLTAPPMAPLAGSPRRHPYAYPTPSPGRKGAGRALVEAGCGVRIQNRAVAGSVLEPSVDVADIEWQRIVEVVNGSSRHGPDPSGSGAMGGVVA